LTELKYSCATPFCDWIVGICDATVENLKEAHPRQAEKMVRVYNGILPIVRAPKGKWPAKSGFTFVFVGRLAPVKNLGLLLDAFSAALEEEPNLRLWLVGDGSERRVLEDRARRGGIDSKIRFWGEQLDPGRFFSAADVFVMSSASEGLPISLLQAFSIGLPAIVTDAGGMSEAVHLAKAGLIVSKTDPSGMAEAMLGLARDERQRLLFGENALAAFTTNFTLRSAVSGYEELYRASRRR
jgi:glycosyltransferase involved in cell wall biosynthesis